MCLFLFDYDLPRPPSSDLASPYRDGPLPEVPTVVQEYSVPMDPLWDGMAGLDHQTHPFPAGDAREILFLLPPQLQRELAAPKLEAEPGLGGRTPFTTARLPSGGAYGNHTASRTLYSGLMLWKGQLVLLQYVFIFFLSTKTPGFKLST